MTPCPLIQAISSFTVKCEELKTTTGPAPGMAIPFSDHEAVMATLHIQRQGQPAGATLGTAGKLGGRCRHPPCAEGLVDGLVGLYGVLWGCFPLCCCLWRAAEQWGWGEGYWDDVWWSHHAEGPVPTDLALADVVTEARTEVGLGLRAAQRQRYSWGRMAVLALLLLLLQAAAALATLAGLGAEQPFPKLSFCLLAFLSIAILVLATGLHIFHTMEVKILHGTEDQMWMALRALQERPSEG